MLRAVPLAYYAVVGAGTEALGLAGVADHRSLGQDLKAMPEAFAGSGGWLRRAPAAPRTVVQLPRSLEASAPEIFVRDGGKLVGNAIDDVQLITRGRAIREVKRLVDVHGGKAKGWRKMKGVATVHPRQALGRRPVVDGGALVDVGVIGKGGDRFAPGGHDRSSKHPASG